MNLQVHGEVTDTEVDIFDREKVFIDTVLRPLIERLPQLKVVMEHVTTEDAVRFVESCKEGTFCYFLHSREYFLLLPFLNLDSTSQHQ